MCPLNKDSKCATSNCPHNLRSQLVPLAMVLTVGLYIQDTRTVFLLKECIFFFFEHRLYCVHIALSVAWSSHDFFVVWILSISAQIWQGVALRRQASKGQPFWKRKRKRQRKRKRKRCITRTPMLDARICGDSQSMAPQRIEWGQLGSCWHLPCCVFTDFLFVW